MIKWMTRINWKKVLLVGLLITLAETLVHMIEAQVMMPYYQMPQYVGVWSRLMMPTQGPPPPEFMIVSTLANFVTGVSLTIIYYYLKDYLPKGFWKRTTYFADLLVATSFLFFTIPTLFLFNIPYALQISWFVSNFIILFASSALIVQLIK